MPTPHQEIPPRDTWRSLIDAGLTKLRRQDGQPLLIMPSEVQEDPARVLRRINKNVYRKAKPDQESNGNRYLKWMDGQHDRKADPMPLCRILAEQEQATP